MAFSAPRRGTRRGSSPCPGPRDQEGRQGPRRTGRSGRCRRVLLARSGAPRPLADRYDIKQYRELYASAAAVPAAREGRPLPDGTVITMVPYRARLDAQGNPLRDANGRFLPGELAGGAVREKRAGWRAEYPDDLRNGEWEDAVFTVGRQLNDKANDRACFQCHKPPAAQGFVISYPALAGRTQDAAVAPPAAGGPGVTMAGFAFAPATLRGPLGQRVTWTNTDRSPHEITVRGPGLKTGLLLEGQSESMTLDQAGSCEDAWALHPAMKGRLDAHCHLGLGALPTGHGDGAEARRHLSDAAALYRGMGMALWQGQAERRTSRRGG